MIDDHIKVYKKWIKRDLPEILASCQTDFQRTIAADGFIKELYLFAILRENINLCDKIKTYWEKQYAIKEGIMKKQNEMFENTNDIIKFIMDL